MEFCIPKLTKVFYPYYHWLVSDENMRERDQLGVGEPEQGWISSFPGLGWRYPGPGGIQFHNAFSSSLIDTVQSLQFHPPSGFQDRAAYSRRSFADLA